MQRIGPAVIKEMMKFQAFPDPNTEAKVSTLNALFSFKNKQKPVTVNCWKHHKSRSAAFCIQSRPRLGHRGSNITPDASTSSTLYNYTVN